MSEAALLKCPLTAQRRRYVASELGALRCRTPNVRGSMSNTFNVDGRAFNWSLAFQTGEFEPLLRLIASESSVDVLRISSVDKGFDIAVRINVSTYADGSKARHLGPILVLGSGLATHGRHVLPGTMVRIRPRVSVMSEGGGAGADASRLVQWCLSPHFRAVRVTASGSIWNETRALHSTRHG